MNKQTRFDLSEKLDELLERGSTRSWLAIRTPAEMRRDQELARLDEPDQQLERPPLARQFFGFALPLFVILISILYYLFSN